MNEALIQMFLPPIQALRRYHRHEVKGMERVPSEGRALLVVTHSLATYDILLLFHSVLEEKGRTPRPLVDRLFYKIPLMDKFIEATGGTQGSPQGAESLLNDDQLVAVAPGGMREALRPSSERYQILWDKRLGFVKLAIRTRTPIILAVCPKADDLYDVYSNPITAWAYRKLKIPLFFARGVGPTGIPRPVKLTHFLSKPIMPPDISEDDPDFRKKVAKFHEQLVKQTRLLIGDAVAYRPAHLSQSSED